MFEARRSDLDEVGKLEASLERSRHDASVEILSLVRIIGALAGHGELVLLRHDLDVVGSEPCDRQGDAEAVIAKLHNIEERIAVVLACSRLKQVEKTVKAASVSPVQRKVEVVSHFQILQRKNLGMRR